MEGKVGRENNESKMMKRKKSMEGRSKKAKQWKAEAKRRKGKAVEGSVRVQKSGNEMLEGKKAGSNTNEHCDHIKLFEGNEPRCATT